jgi:hypothetical protein
MWVKKWIYLLKIKVESMKKIIGTIIILLCLGYSTFQLLRPIIPKEEAISKAKDYVKIVNYKENLNYNISKPIRGIRLDNSFMNRIIGNQSWVVFVDGIEVEVNANTGDFKRMIFPMDGIITKGEHPNWFQ